MKRFTLLFIILLALSAVAQVTDVVVIEEVVSSPSTEADDAVNVLVDELAVNETVVVDNSTSDSPSDVSETESAEPVSEITSGLVLELPEPVIFTEENLTIVEQVEVPAVAPELADALDVMTESLGEENITEIVEVPAEPEIVEEIIEQPEIIINTTTEIIVDENLTVVEEITSPASAPFVEDSLEVMIEELQNETVEAQNASLPGVELENISVTVQNETLANESVVNASPEVFSITVLEYSNGPIKEITLINASNASELRIDNVPAVMPVPVEGMSWAQIYAIDPTKTEFEIGIVEVVAKGKSLYKCKDWNFDGRTCGGDWVLVAEDMVPGNTYYLEIDPADPAFGEIIAIDAVHLDESYSVVSSVYGDISVIDGAWSEPIPDGHFVRVKFESELSSGSVIDLLARDNGTVSYIEVYVANTSTLVGRSGIANPVELQYITLENAPYPTDTFDLKIVKHYHNLSEELCDEDNADCADGSIADNAKSGFIEFDFIHDEAALLTGANGLLAYTESAVNAPRYVLWNRTTTVFGAELTASVDIGAQSDWTVLKSNHERDEFILMELDESTNTTVQIWNGSAWGNFVELATENPNTAQSSIDFAIEGISGDALFVYETVSAADTDVGFRTWNGSAYGAPQILTHGVSSPVRWIKIVERPGTDEIMLLMHTTSNDLIGVLWNGSSFVPSTMFNLTAAVNIVAEMAFDFVWEGTSGEGIAVYGNSGAPTTYAYNKFFTSNDSWSGQGTFFTLNGGANNGIRLCADPFSNYVGAVTQDSTNDINFVVWNGTAVEASPPTEDSTAEANAAGAMSTDCAWMKNGTAVFGSVTNAAPEDQFMMYCTYDKTAWSSATIAGCALGPNLSITIGAVEALELFAHPVTSEIMVLGFNVDEDLDSARWNGTAWTNRTSIESALDCLNGATQCAGFDWDRYDPVPNASIVVPVNATSFSPSSVVNITASSADNVAVGSVNASVVLPNGTVRAFTLSLVSGTSASGTYGLNFTETSAVGTYNFTVQSSDSSTHSNKKIVSGFFNVAAGGPVVSGAYIVPTVPYVGNSVCLKTNVSDADGVGNVTATIDRPAGADQFVTLLDTHTCNSVAGDGVYSNLYYVTVEGIHTWTTVNATDALGNPSSTAIGTTFESFSGIPIPPSNIHPTKAVYHDFSEVNISLINVSDDATATQSAIVNASTFMYFNWSLSFTGTITNSNVTIEHKYDFLGSPVARLQIFSGSTWQDVCSLSISSVDTVDTCDLDSFVSGSVSVINSLQLRINLSADDNTTQHVDEVFLQVANSSTDAIAPVISAVSSEEGNDTVNITWTTDESANSSVNYGKTLGLGTVKDDASLVTTHLLGLSDLSEGTLYFYNITSCDSSNNCNTSGPYNFTTTALVTFEITSFGGALLNATIEVRNGDDTLEANFTGKNSSVYISPGIKKLRLLPVSGPVVEINLTDVNLTAGMLNFGFDDTPEGVVAKPPTSLSSWEQVFAVDPTNLNFTGGTVTVNATGRRLLKCANWNFTARDCPANNWTSLRSISPGELYTFNISLLDPGFGEINATAAEHLDENQTFISDIFAQINETDGVYSETIPENHTVRVTFQANLTNGSVIDIIARDNGTVSFVEVYVANTSTLVGRSGIANPTEPQFIELQNMPNETDVFDLRVVKLVHNITADSCPGDPECNASSIAENNLTALLEFDFIHDQAVSASGSDGLLSYAESAVGAPRYRFWNNSNTSYTVELTDTNNPGAPAAWLVLQPNPIRDEILMGVLDTSTNTSAQIYNGVNWTGFVRLAFDAPNTGRRSFDVAFEQVSGDGIIVYENSTAANSQVAYNTWNGSAWSVQGTLTTNLSGAVSWIKTVPRPRSNEIMILLEDSNLDLFGILWNGTDFVNSTQFNITGSINNIDEQLYDFVWPGNGTQGLVGYANSTTAYAFRTFNATSRAWSTDNALLTLNSGAPNGMRLCGDPTSEYAGFVSQDTSADGNFLIFNGTGIETSPAPPAEDTNIEPNSAAAINLDCGFEKQSGMGLFVYVKNPPGTDDDLSICLYNKTAWSFASMSSCPISGTFHGPGNAIESDELFPSPVTNDMMASTFNFAEDLTMGRWNGSNFTNITTVETSLDCNNGQTFCGSFAWESFDPPPNVSILSPANNSNFTSGSTVNITANVTDNLNVSSVNVSVVLPNGTVLQSTMTLVQGNSTDGNYSINFTNTTSTGQYNFTVQATDGNGLASYASGFFNVAASGVNSTNVSVVKIDIPDPVLIGATLTYLINISNTGNDTAINVTLFEVYPVNVTFNGSQPAPSSGNNTFDLGNLSGGSSTTVNITVNVSSGTGNGTVLNNTAVVNYTNSSGSQATNSSVLTTVVGFPVIITNKSDSPDPVLNGSTLSYQILINNTGTEIAYNVTVVDVYPASGVTFNGSAPVPSSGNGTWSLGNILPGGFATINITVNVSAANGTILANAYNVTFANNSGVNLTVSNSTTTTVRGQRNLTITKTDNPDPVTSGATLSYTITINNTGDDDAFNVTVIEIYPVNVTFNGSAPVPTSGNNTWLLGNLSPSQSTTINITVNVSSAMTSGSLNNTVFANASSFFGTNQTVNATEFTTVIAPGVNVSNISLAKTGSPDPVVRGSVLNYTITVNSTGNTTAFNVTILEDYPAGVSFVSSSPAPSSGNNTFDLGNLTNGTNTTINISLTVGSNLLNGTVLNNTVNATFQQDYGVNSTATTSETTTVIGFPEIFTSKSDSSDPVVNGTTLTYQILINNTGDEIAYNVTVVDVYPVSGVTFDGSTPAPSSGNNTFSVGNILPGGFTTINITVNVSAANGTVLNNSYNVTFANNSGVNLTVSNSTTTTVQGTGIAVAIKSDSPDPVVRGQSLNYSILVNNTGDEIVYNVTLVESYPSGVSFVLSSPAPSSGNNTFALGNLAPNQSTTVNITVTVGLNVLNGTSLTNFVNATYSNLSGLNASSTDTELTTVIGFPEIFTNKLDTPDPVGTNATLSYQIVINNTGDEIAYNITVVEGYPANVTFNGSDPVPTSGNNTFSIGNLLPGQNTTINITVNVSSGNGTVLNNSYNVTFANFSGVNLTIANNTLTNVTSDTVPPNVTILSPLGLPSVLLNESVNISANVTDNLGAVSTVLALITLPTGVNVSDYMVLTGGIYSLNFSNLTLRGIYNITIIASDTTGNVNDSETASFNRRALNIIDVVNASESFLNYSVAVLGNISDILNLSVDFNNTRIHQINITSHNESSPYSILIIDNEYPINETPFFAEYAVDPSGINFTNMSIFVTAAGDSLLSICKDYNITEQDCFGNWSQYLNISVGQNYTINLTPNDPGFLETTDAVDVAVAPINFTSFVIAFINNSGASVQFSVMNTNGSTIVPITTVDTIANNISSRVDVAMLNSSHFAMVWSKGPSNNMSMEIFGVDGTNVTPPTFLGTIGLNNDVAIAALGDRYEVCYANDTSNDAEFRIFFNNGTQAVSTTAVDTNIAPGAPLQNLVDCTSMNSTRWTYFWYDDADNDVTFSMQDDNGATIVAATDIDTAVGEFGQVAVTTLQSNMSAFVFYDTADQDITITVRDSTGAVITAPTDIDTAAGTISRVAAGTVRMNDTSTEDLFVPVWYDNASNDIKAAVYEFDGTQVTAPFVVSTQPDSTFRLLDVAGRVPITNTTLCPGRFVVAFSNSSDQGLFLGFLVNGSSWDGTCDFANIITNKTDSPDPVPRGTTLSYQILINNTGEFTAFNVTVVEGYPENVTFNGSQPAPSSGNNTWNLGDIVAGGFTTINITVNVSSGASGGELLNNSYNVTFSNGSGTNLTVSNSTNTTVLGAPVIVAIKSDSPDPVVRGTALNYTIVVNNTGDETAFNVTLVEDYPPNVTFDSASPSPTSGNNTWALGNLTAGNSTTVMIRVNVSPILPNGTVLNNSVNATFSNSSGQNLTVNDSELTTVISDFAPSVLLVFPPNATNTTNITINFAFNATDDVSLTMNCSIDINGTISGTNSSTFNNTITNFTVTFATQGNRTWNVSCIDGSNNTNTSETRIFTVDFTPPDFISQYFTPSDNDSLDPGVFMEFFVNVTDNFSAVDTVVLHMTFANGTSIANITTSYNSTTGEFNASFIPLVIGNYTFFYTANDTVGNNGTSSAVNFTIDYEATWTRSPAVLTPVSATPGQNVTVGTITINNTGDFTLNFTLDSTFVPTFLNESNFSLAPNSTRLIQVNVTAPGASGVFTGNITMNATSTNSSYPASPAQLNTSFTVVTIDSAFLFAFFTIIPVSVTQGEVGVTIEATVNNTGTQDAENVTLNITLPPDWILTGGSLSGFFASIAPNDTESIAITVAIPAGAVLGLRNVTTFADGQNVNGSNLTTQNLTQNTTEQVLVKAPTPFGPGGGGGGAGGGAGGGGAGGGGGPSGAFVKTLDVPVLITNDTIEVVRGEKIGFPLEVTNVYNDSIMRAVSLDVQGYLRKYVSWTPEILENILYGHTKSFFITLAAPAYMNESTIEITFVITAGLEAPGVEYRNGIPFEVMLTKKVIEYKTVRLIIRELSEKEAVLLVSEVEKLYDDVVSKGYPHVSADILMSDLRLAIAEDRRTEIPYLTAKLKDLLLRELDAANSIEQLKQRISEAVVRGLDVSEAQRILKLAEKAFAQEDFDKASTRALEAMEIELIETKRAFNLANFIYRYWWALLLAAGAGSVLAYRGYRRVLVYYIRTRLIALAKEQAVLMKNMEEVQEACFVKKVISTGEYFKAMSQYERQSERIKSDFVRLRLLRARLFTPQLALKTALEEKVQVTNAFRQTQEDYFELGKISRRRYVQRSREINLLLSEIDNAILLLKEKVRK